MGINKCCDGGKTFVTPPPSQTPPHAQAETKPRIVNPVVTTFTNNTPPGGLGRQLPQHTLFTLMHVSIFVYSTRLSDSHVVRFVFQLFSFHFFFILLFFHFLFCCRNMKQTLRTRFRWVIKGRDVGQAPPVLILMHYLCKCSTAVRGHGRLSRGTSCYWAMSSCTDHDVGQEHPLSHYHSDLCWQWC